MRIAIAAVALLALAVPPAQGQQPFPVRPIRLVVSFGPGGTPDTLARMIGPKMSETFRQPVVIENRPGAGGSIAASIVAKAAPDGYTLLMVSPSFAITAALQSSLSYDPVKDFAGVAQIGYSTTVLVASPSLGVKSVKELIALAHAQPGKILFGSAGAGSATHMNGERFKAAAGIRATHVGFKGQPEFLLEVATGRVHYGVAGLGPAMAFIKEGRVIPLAVALSQRSSVLPDVPAAPEVLPGWSRDGSQAMLAPARTPRTIVDQLNKEVLRILALPEVRERLQSYDFHIVPSTPEELDKSLRADIETFRKVGRAAGLIAK
ncbi:MAG TPA: tripartite tricarboxylate transporter substrate binding protein [Burkholderiales bacterium]|nr:tripartite tricarboxylate transporter substrate binding protein [Burkholderiales bacterium]